MSDGGGGGGGADAGSAVQLIGAAQKGPFSVGSTVQLSLLDGLANPTGIVLNSTTRSDLGDFELMVPQAGPIEIATTGYYFNELSGALSTSQITLRAVVELTDAPTQTVYVNALTQLSYLRAKKLIAGGATLSAAVKQAEGELVKALPLFRSASTTAGSSLNLLGDDSDDNAYLLALSCLLGQGAEDGAPQSVDAKLQEIVSTIALDLEDDGAITVENSALLVSARDNLDAGRCTTNFAAWRTARGITTPMPQIERALDWDRDGLSDFADDDDDGDGIVAANDKAVATAGNVVIDSGGQGWYVFARPQMLVLPGKAVQVMNYFPDAKPVAVVLLEDGRVYRVVDDSEPQPVVGLSAIVWLGGGSILGFTAVDANGDAWFVDDSAIPSVQPLAPFNDLKAVVHQTSSVWLRQDGTVWAQDSMSNLVQIAGLPSVTQLEMNPLGELRLLGGDGTVWSLDRGTFESTMVSSNVHTLSKDGDYAIKHDGTVWQVFAAGELQLTGITSAVAAGGFGNIGTGVHVAFSDGSVVSIQDSLKATPVIRPVAIPR